MFISVFNQLDAQNLFYNKFYFMPVHVSSTCARNLYRHEIKLIVKQILCIKLVKYWDKHYWNVDGASHILGFLTLKAKRVCFSKMSENVYNSTTCVTPEELYSFNELLFEFRSEKYQSLYSVNAQAHYIINSYITILISDSYTKNQNKLRAIEVVFVWCLFETASW